MIRELSPSTLHTHTEREREKEREREILTCIKLMNTKRVRSGNCEMYVINQSKVNAQHTIYKPPTSSRLHFEVL